MMSARFAIVVPAYNQAAWLAGTLRSALSQSRPADEVIVVNDGSTDETPRILRAFADRVTVIHQENRGLSATRNRGAAEARSDYIVYLDSDDLLMPWALEVLAAEVAAANEPSVVLSLSTLFREEDELAEIQRVTAQVERWPDYLASAPARYRVTVAGAIRREVLLGCGGFADAANGAEDHDFWLRTGTATGFSYLKSPPIYAYRQHGDSITQHPDRIGRGLHFILEEERAGRYPGGRERRRERRKLIGRLVAWGIRRCHATGGMEVARSLFVRATGILWSAGMYRQQARLALLLLNQPKRHQKANTKGEQ